MRGYMEGVSMALSGGVLRTIGIPPYADGAYAGTPFAMTTHACACLRGKARFISEPRLREETDKRKDACRKRDPVRAI